jgi:hypothetical protein
VAVHPNPARGDATDPDPSLRWPIVVFLAVAAVLFVVVWVGHSALPESPEAVPRPLTPLDPLLGGWTQFDAGWYTGIAANGYSFVPGAASAVAFFPAYPLAIRVLTEVTGAPATAGMLITFICGFGVALLWWVWLRLKVPPASRRLSFVLLLIWPYAWYLYGAVYADALFLVATLGAFVLLEHDRPVLAGLAAAVATAARPVGIAVVIGMVVWVLERRLRAPAPTAVSGTTDAAGRWAWVRRFRLADAGVLLGLLGIGAWSVYLWNRFGDPLAFVAAQQGWEQGQGPETWFKLTLLEMIGDLRPYAIRLIPQAVAALAFLALVPAVVRRYGWGYGLYTLTVVGIPFVGSSTLQGLGRYMLAAFPVFAWIGEWLTRRPRLARVAVVVSALGLVFGAALYSMGWYVA